jgi:hypothetical protein
VTVYAHDIDAERAERPAPSLAAQNSVTDRV